MLSAAAGIVIAAIVIRFNDEIEQKADQAEDKSAPEGGPKSSDRESFYDHRCQIE